MMWRAAEASDADEIAMRAQILLVLEEICRDMTLRDVREWYFDSVKEGERTRHR